MNETMSQGDTAQLLDFSAQQDEENRQTYANLASRRSVDWRDSGIVIDDALIEEFDLINGQSNLDLSCESLKEAKFYPIAQTDQQDDDGDTLLHIAVVSCTPQYVRDLIKFCDINVANYKKQTPLIVATMANRCDMVELLLHAGAKIDARDRKGDTILHLACQKGFNDVVKAILEFMRSPYDRKNFIELANYDGLTCLHLASISNEREILRMLVSDYETDVNIQDKRSGETILHKALAKTDPDLIAFILDFKRHCNQPDYSGRWPLDTVAKLLEYSCDKKQVEKLNIASQLIRERIEACIRDQVGCCNETMLKLNSLHCNEMDSIHSNSSGSDYTDSETD